MTKEFFKLGWRILNSNFRVLSEPYKITFAITYKCNSRCKTCEIWKKRPKNELTTKEMEKIFQKINPSWVNLTGGETFLRRDIYQIAKIIRENTDAYLLNSTTNGLLGGLVFREAKKISNLGFSNFIVVVSLDGPEKIHDKIRGIKGNWKKSVELYKKLKELSRENPNFQTFFGYTISKYNVGKIEETIKSVKKEIDVSISDFHFNIFHVSKCYYGNQDQKSLLNFKEKIMKDVNHVIKEKGGLNPISFTEKKYLKLIKKYYKTGMSPLPCKALSSSCFIEPDGGVYPCTSYANKLGNLRDFNYDLRKIWNSEKSKKVRKLIKDNKCGGCWTPCEAYQTIFGNLLRI